MMVIGISGQANSGKDTVADMLVDEHDYMKVSLADPIKTFAQRTFRFTQDQLWGPSSSRNLPDERYDMTTAGGATAWEAAQRRLEQHCGMFAASLFPDEPMMAAAATAALPVWCEELRQVVGKGALSPRIMLQSLGTEFGRRIDPDIWIKHAYRIVSKLDTTAVVSDIRFANELNFIKNHQGFLVRIKRKSTDMLANNLGLENHASELEQKSFNDADFNFIINNDKNIAYLSAEVERIADVVTVILDGRKHAQNSNS